MYMQARYYDPVIGRFYSNDPNCTNVIKKGGSSGRESRAGAVKRIVSEVEAIGDFKNKGEADWLYELIDDRNLEVTVQAGLITVRVLLPLRLAPNGHVQADAIIVGGYSVHGQSTIRHRPDCSGRLNPNTLLSGSITLNEEVFNGKKTTSII